MNSQSGPLEGVKVLELGSSVAGPFCGRLLADFGAEVIKVEVATGDAVRNMSKRVNGRSLYAASILRNKKIISVNLKSDEGRDLIKEICRRVDIVVENFRPGTLERWGLGYDVLSVVNPGLIMVRISGFGQTGPYSSRAGYGAIGDAVSGLRHLTGDPDRPPSRIAASVVDEVTGLYGAFGAMMALRVREKTGRGQQVDSALYEAAFSLIEPHVPAYSKLGIVPNREGSRLPDSAPNNLYLAKDGKYIHITAMGDAVFARLAEAIGAPELAQDPNYKQQESRSRNEDALDAMIAAWVARFDALELERHLERYGVPAARIYDIADVFADPHFRAREMLIDIDAPGIGPLTVPGIVPKLSATPGSVRHAGHDTGEDTQNVLRDLLNLDEQVIGRLVQNGIVFCAETAVKELES